MLRLVMETISIVGFIIASLYHSSDILSIPIAFVGLAWVVAVRYIPHSVDPVMLFWVTYGLLLYQLVSFHDFNGCFLEECKTNEMYSYIMLGSTAVFWFQMRESVPDKIKLKEPTKKVEQPIEQPAKLAPMEYPTVKIRITKEMPTGPIRLNMGDRVQSKWV